MLFAIKYSFMKNDFTRDDAKTIYHLAGSIPYNIQLLCSEIYNLVLINKNLPMNEIINHGYDNVLNSKNEEYIILYENMSKSVRLALEIVIKSDGKHLFNNELLSDFRVAPSTLKKSLDKLIRDGILFRENKSYLFQDIFFRQWMENRL
jgi:hypothetical protein